MVEFVHDEGYVNTLHLDVIDPDLVKAVCTKVASQVNFFAYSRDKFPGLSLFDGLLVLELKNR